MYFWFAIGGVYGALIGGAPELVEIAMGHNVYTFWIWLNIIGPVMVFFGIYRVSAKDKEKHYKQPQSSSVLVKRANGLWLQLLGDITVFFALSAYVVAMLVESYWGRGVYAVFGYAGLSMCAALLVVADIRRILEYTEWRK